MWLLDTQVKQIALLFLKVIRLIASMEKNLMACSTQEERAQLADVTLKLVDAEERTIARIESIFSTISKLKRDEISAEKEIQQTLLIAQTI